VGLTIRVVGLTLLLASATASAGVFVFGRTADIRKGHFVWQFDDQGSFVRSFPVEADSYGCYGMGLDSKGNLYLGMCGTVNEYTADGAFVRTVITGADHTIHGSIVKVIVPDQNSVYLASSDGSSAKFKSDGSVDAVFPGGRYAGAIAVDDYGKVYAAENGRTEGVFRRWAATGGESELALPWTHGTSDMDFDPQSNLIYAIDSKRSVVYVHDLNGQPVSQIQLPSVPSKIDYDPTSRRLFTMDMNAGLVRELGPGGNVIRYIFPPGCASAFAFAVQVPEPGCLPLLAIGGAAMLRRRR
jgi:hypothetical protein